MYISHVSIRNFRSLKSVDIDFHPGKNVIIGKNNSGKSNIIKALNYVLGELYPTYIQFKDDDFYVVNTDDETEASNYFLILVELKHGDTNTDFNVTEIMRYSKKICLVLTSDPILSTNMHDLNSFYLNSFETGYEYEKKWEWSDKVATYIENAESISIFLRVDREDMSVNYGIVLHGVKEIERGSVFSQDYLIYQINNNLRDSLITSAVIPAIRSPVSELKINNNSWYTKMLKESWANISIDNQNKLKELIKELNSVSNSCYEHSLTKITSDVSKIINAQSVDIQLAAENGNDMYKNAQIYVDDSGLKTSLEAKGTGTQSSVIISLFLYYCKVMHKSGSLLAIEEPECYLHPHARRSLSSNLDSFVSEQNGGKPANQIILTTHSAEFIKGTKFENIVLIKKSKFGGAECAAMKDNTIINNYRQKVEKIINSRNAELFFADCVILVEGGEEHLLPLIAESIDDDSDKKDNPLDRYNISVINVTGKSHFPEYSHLLSDLGIKYYIIADFDILSKNADIEKLKHNSEILDLSVDGELSREECLNWIHGLIANQTTVDKKPHETSSQAP